MTEMKEASFILKNIQNEEASLVVIDELGRSTGTEDAIGIISAIIEVLLKSNV